MVSKFVNSSGNSKLSISRSTSFLVSTHSSVTISISNTSSFNALFISLIDSKAADPLDLASSLILEILSAISLNVFRAEPRVFLIRLNKSNAAVSSLVIISLMKRLISCTECAKSSTPFKNGALLVSHSFSESRIVSTDLRSFSYFSFNRVNFWATLATGSLVPFSALAIVIRRPSCLSTPTVRSESKVAVSFRTSNIKLVTL
mmetsp:Transcript_42151/g.48504  ORF Transcript_42151/g.48504 Transcript_42151/m.48504 type:complete len:203 (-) Transcript_42151:449-1057(-)